MFLAPKRIWQQKNVKRNLQKISFQNNLPQVTQYFILDHVVHSRKQIGQQQYLIQDKKKLKENL